MSNNNRIDSDDDRYFYEHYKGQNYYSSSSGFERSRWKIDLALWILLIIFLVLAH